jgi:hypothetical protein
MPFRPLALLTAAALLALGAPAVAQQSSPEPNASPEPAATGAGGLRWEASPGPKPEPVSSPAPEESPAHSLRGTLMSLKGTIATVKMANGAVQTFTVPGQTAAVLKRSIGKKLLFRVVKGALDIVPH